MERHNIPPSNFSWNGYLFSYPVNCQIPFLQPGHSKNDLFTSQVQDHKADAFFVLRKMEVDSGFPNYVPLGIGGAIYVVCLDWPFKPLQWEFG